MKAYTKLRALGAPEMQGELEFGHLIGQAALALASAGGLHRVQITVLDGEGASRSWSISVAHGHSEVARTRIPSPELEFISTEGTFRRIASGTYSPIRAFLEGRMRVQGDVELGEALLVRLGDGNGQAHC